MTGGEMRTLWRCRLRVGGSGRQEFLFRETEEFSKASATAQELVRKSKGAEMSNAEIVAVEYVAYLWN